MLTRISLVPFPVLDRTLSHRLLLPSKNYTHRWSSTDKRRMQAWKINEYGGTDKLMLSRDHQVPFVSSPSDVLVKVHASSVNPIDVKMLGGYGATMLNAVRKIKEFPSQTSEFPLILGRDFSGQVVSTGRSSAAGHIQPGDEVWGVADPLLSQGAHAEYILVKSNMVSKKPTSFSHVEAAAFPYIAMTCWAALSTAGGLSRTNTPGKRVLVLGGAGGVGTFAIQLLRNWGAEVITTCSTDSVNLLESLGADVVIDYKQSDVKQALQMYKGIDVILDFAGKNQYQWATQLLQKNEKFVTITTPMLENTDRHGLTVGAAFSLVSLASNVFPNLNEGKFYRWAIFVPNMKPLNIIKDFAKLNKIQPVIEKVFPFSQLPAAYDKVAAGHNRGKIIVDMTADEASEDVMREKSSRVAS